jgi:hypothetical protein
MVCYQPKLQAAASSYHRASVTFAFIFAIATFVSSMIFLTAAFASAALVSYLAWSTKWCMCACGSCCTYRSCDSKREGSCGGFGFGVWRRFFEQL